MGLEHQEALLHIKTLYTVLRGQRREGSLVGHPQKSGAGCCHARRLCLKKQCCLSHPHGLKHQGM